MVTATSMLVRYEGSGMARARSWVTLPAADRRRRAASAAQRRDVLCLWGLVEAFMLTKGAAGPQTSPHTLRSYRRGLEDLLTTWQGENLLRPSADAGDLYVSTLAETLKPGTVRVKVAAARAFYKALRWAGATTARPFEEVALPRDPTPAWEKREPYTEAEVARLLAAAGPVDRALVLLGAHGGLRASEIVALTWEDIDLELATVRIRNGKGRKMARVALSHSATTALLAIRPAAVRGPVFRFRTTQRAYDRLRELAEAALGDGGKGLHALRHYCGTRMASELGLEAAQQHLRHSNMATTQIYAKWLGRLPIRQAVTSW